MWARPSLKLGSFWKLRISPKGDEGTTGEARAAGGGGVGIVPSTPTRKLAKPGFPPLPTPGAGLQPAPGVPEALHNGENTFIVWAKPTPSMGMMTLCTV